MQDKRHTYEMGVIGNCAALAYVAKDTSVNWLCLPRFDSTPVFDALVDAERNSCFAVIADRKADYSQQYRPNTNILETTVTTDEYAFKVIDFFPRFLQFDRSFKPLQHMRKISITKGHPRIKILCRPKSTDLQTTQQSHRGSNHLEYRGFLSPLRLTTNLPLTYLEEESEFSLTEEAYFCLSYGTPLEAPLLQTVDSFLFKTTNYWNTWVKHSSIPPVFQEATIRSALVLKLHQYEDTGAIIAAGSTSLPEAPGSERNWDYRYCWMRDSYYTLNAHRLLGHFEEQQAYAKFIENIVARAEQRLQPVYCIDGSSEMVESVLPLPGYQGNKPVRLGNAAYKQIQNDVYGQALISLYPLYTDKRFVHFRKNASLSTIHMLLDKLEHFFDEPDAGLWEFRHLTAKHTYTYLFHWVGARAAMGIAEAFQDKKMLKRAELIASRAKAVIEQAYDEEAGVYRSSLSGKELDASLLNMITLGYLDPLSQKAQKHLAIMEKELKGAEGLFYRYIHDDGFGKPEVCFGVCGTWYIEALAMSGRTEDAIKNFEAFLSTSNHLDLFSEDIHATNKSQWGNFPQIFTHIGVIHCAHAIAAALHKPNFLMTKHDGVSRA